jgi:hypothetical protein
MLKSVADGSDGDAQLGCESLVVQEEVGDAGGRKEDAPNPVRRHGLSFWRVVHVAWGLPVAPADRSAPAQSPALDVPKSGLSNAILRHSGRDASLEPQSSANLVGVCQQLPVVLVDLHVIVSRFQIVDAAYDDQSQKSNQSGQATCCGCAQICELAFAVLRGHSV